MQEEQCTNTILMVRPANFGFNTETAQNNVFQQAQTELSPRQIKELARAEFDHMVERLRQEGANIIVIDDPEKPKLTDAVFPNNWISTHQNGTVFLFPMFSQNRRLERREEIVSSLKSKYQVKQDHSLLAFESSDQYLEGTGSMILDRPNKVIYACYSVRTDKKVLEQFGAKLGYDVVGFDAVDSEGIPYYHTNVIMTLGEHIAIICTESIEDEDQCHRVCEKLRQTGKIIVKISRDQVLKFAGNMLEVKVPVGKRLMVMSTSAYNSLQEDQVNIINNYNKIVHLPLGTIEKFGGGSARCMMAEVFLPKRDIG